MTAPNHTNEKSNAIMLDAATAQFEARQLDAAQKTLAAFFAQSDSCSNTILAKAYHLQGKIVHKQGLYQGSNDLFKTAVQHFDTALELLENDKDSEDYFQVLLAKSTSLRHNNQPQLASCLHDEALRWCDRYSFEQGYIQTNIERCNDAIENNAFDYATQLCNDCMRWIEKHLPAPHAERISATVYNLLGRIQIKRQDIVETLKISSVALEHSRKYGDIENELTALNNLAIVHGIKSDYRQAMEYLIEALKLSKRIGYRRQIARCQINLGSIYAHLFNYEAALQQYQDCLEQYSDVIETGTQVILLNNIGNIYLDKQQAKQATDYFRRAYQLARISQYRQMEALSLAQLGRAFFQLQKTDKALDKALQAKILLDELGEVNGVQINRINLGEIYLHQGALDLAAKYLSQGIVFSKQLQDSLNEIRGYKLLADTYLQQDKTTLAYRYLNIYTHYQQKYSKIQRNRQLLDLEIRYDIQEKQQEIERLQIENEYQGILLKQKDQIEHQNRQLTEANQELKQFASIVSHDLKEPLRMIGSFAELLQRHPSVSDPTAQEYLHFVTDGVARMNRLLHGIMHYSMVGREEEADTAVNLNELLEVCCLHLRQPIEASGAVVTLADLPTIVSKYTLLLQLFQNLLSNAIKFRKPDTTPHIEVSVVTALPQLQLCVSDNGIGISEKNIQRIFNIFQRLHTAEAYEGTGVGLAVCQKIVKRLGGKIWASSKIGQGTKFFVQLPLKKGEA